MGFDSMRAAVVPRRPATTAQGNMKQHMMEAESLQATILSRHALLI